MPTTDELPPLRRRDLRAYRVGTLRRRSRRQVGAVVASFVGVALLAVVAPPVLSGDTPAEAVAGLPGRLAGLGDLAARGADQAVRGADGAIGAIVASRSGGRDTIPQAPSPSAMASAAVGSPRVAAQGLMSSATATATASASPIAPSAPAGTPGSNAAGAAPTAAAPAAPIAPAPAGAAQAPVVGQEAAPATGAPPAAAAASPPAAAPSPAASPSAAAPSLTADEQYAARLVTLANAERTKVGLASLATSPCATAQAAARAAVLVAQGRFEHDPLDPIVAACGGSSVGENLALGYRTPEAMMAGWMASSGHRENILRGYGSIGIGCVTGPAGVLCSQVFLG